MGALDEVRSSNAKTIRKKTSNGQGGNASPITVNGYDAGEVVSALQKTIRRGQEYEALYWASELMASDRTWHMWKRLIVIAAEDVGLADPDMVMRITTMKIAHDTGREANIPFLAVMLLCRAPKNREADDASYLYDEKRKKGWKLPMPAIAVDGHTRAGKTRLYSLARASAEDFLTTWCREFYFDAALLKGYVEDEGSPSFPGVSEPYRRELMQFFSLPFDTYDVETCKQPRILTGGLSAAAEKERTARRIPEDPSIVPWAVQGTGEVVPGVYRVQSFTDPSIWYRVDTNELMCTCPAQGGIPGGGFCKHLLAVEQWRSENE